ncbi:BRO family, N-terminal domain [Paenibacillus sp. RU5A]|nr:BRO family, N-terminal domain [Paenibacillus sp. RU5A]SOC67506.1 BRO family, N-terminal domain [Paenibacillus sp. RU26A]SOC68929.1 BRO family, N-terminal domain [Paenibacillus sp. RU5M]
MDKQIQIFNFNSSAVRVIEKDGQPWWVAKDVCEVLDLSNPTVVLQRLDNDEVAKFNLGGLHGEANVVNEFGLYSLILGSRKPDAKQFKRWITHEVIPSIRKSGSYNMPALSSELQAIFVLDQRTQEFDQRLHRIENNTTIDHSQLLSLQTAAHKVVTDLLGGRDTEAYRNKGLRSKVYKALWRDYKGYFNINSYHNTLKKSFDRALEHIESWKLPGQLQREIEESNRQMAF